MINKNIDKDKLKNSISTSEFYSNEIGQKNKTVSGQDVYFCPFHDDRNNPNFYVNQDGAFKCFACGVSGGDIISYYQAKNKVEFKTAIQRLAEQYSPHLIPNNNSNGSAPASGEIVATYDYEDEKGNLLYQAVRYQPKKFSQRVPDGNGGWFHKMDGIRRVLYNLPKVIARDDIYIVEGEKDANTLNEKGLVATCNVGGANHWKKYEAEYNPHLKGKNIVIIPDNDSAGKDHANQVASSLFDSTASIKICELPLINKGADVSDYLNANSIDDLKKLVAEAPTFVPSQTETANDDDDEDLKVKEKLVNIAISKGKLFHDDADAGYCQVKEDDFLQTFYIRSKAFKNWLTHKFFTEENSVPPKSAFTDAVDTLEAIANFKGEQEKVYLRVAHLEGRIYIDLATGKMVEISKAGWEIKPTSINFIQPAGMLPLPEPVKDGDFLQLRNFINGSGNDGNDFLMIASCILGSYQPHGAFPILSINGEQGSAKSTLAKVIRALIDPNKTALRSSPREERDLFIAANNSHLISIDNVSKIRAWLSDGLCRLATGSGFATRRLFTDTDEVLINVKRSIVLNGIESFIEREDLRDRSVTVNLPTVTDRRRKDEETFWAGFNAALPSILGGLYDILVAQLNEIENVHLETMPRMADFCKWITAAERALKIQDGTFQDLYEKNRHEAISSNLEDNPLAQEIISIAEDGFEGRAADLVSELKKRADDEGIQKFNLSRKNPPLSCANKLRRLAPELSKVGITVQNVRLTKGRIWKIFKNGNEGDIAVIGDMEMTPVSASSEAVNVQHDLYDSNNTDFN